MDYWRSDKDVVVDSAICIDLVCSCYEMCFFRSTERSLLFVRFKFRCLFNRLK